jgi:hypothetical protein
MPENTQEQLERVRQLLTNYQYKIEGQWFYQQTLVIDGYAYVRCRFDNCHIHLRRGDFVLDHCYFGYCTVWFWDDALTAIRLYNIFSTPPDSFPDHIRPIKHEDGTVTVSKMAE